METCKKNTFSRINPFNWWSTNYITFIIIKTCFKFLCIYQIPWSIMGNPQLHPWGYKILVIFQLQTIVSRKNFKTHQVWSRMKISIIINISVLRFLQICQRFFWYKISIDSKLIKTHKNVEKNPKNDIMSNNRYFKVVLYKKNEICIWYNLSYLIIILYVLIKKYEFYKYTLLWNII